MPRFRLRRDPAASVPGPEPVAAPPTVVVMTMARDEGDLLPRWVRHYAGQVGIENLVVLDDHSTDGSTDDLGCTVHRLPSLTGKKFERTRMDLLSGLAGGFLAAYDVVVFVDVDEFLIPDPTKHADLRSFLAARPDVDVIAPMALNLVHVPGHEPALDPDRPVLDQRGFAQFVPVMCKPSIKRVPAAWRWASHGIDAPFEVDRELYMVHLKFADRDVLRRMASKRKALADSEGRAKASSWSREVDEIIEVLDATASGVDPQTTVEFDPASVDLSDVVARKDGWWRAAGMGQVQALERLPVQRVPRALRGML